MTLDATAAVGLGPFRLDVAVRVEAGEVLALLGPNGAGKSTLLRCLCGLLALDAGRVTLDGVVLDEPATGTFVAPERRPVGVVFQDYLLFENMTAVENVAFGLRARGVGRADARRRAHEWLERVGLAGQAGQRPRSLSGGQAQRVALARALATEPRLLLLDEPLAALDAGARSDIRRELRRQLDAFDGMRVLVTHDPLDAYALADRVVVLEGGGVVQSGTLAAVAAHPRSRYVADLVGINLLAGTLRADALTLANGAVVVAAPDGADARADGPAFAAVHPHAVALHHAHPEGSPRNVWACTVTDIDRRLDRVRVVLDGPVPLVAEITAGSLASLGLRPGDAVWASVKATEVTTYPA